MCKFHFCLPSQLGQLLFIKEFAPTGAISFLEQNTLFWMEYIILRSNEDFPYHFKKIIVGYKKIGYNIDVLRQMACLVVNPIKVNSFAYLFNCMTVGRASD